MRDPTDPRRWTQLEFDFPYAEPTEPEPDAARTIAEVIYIADVLAKRYAAFCNRVDHHLNEIRAESRA